MAAEPLLDVAADRALEPRRSGTYFRLLALQSLAFFFTFAAFNAAQALAGSIPAPPGLAPIQFMAIYVTFAFLCIHAPKLLSRIGPKACMILGIAHAERCTLPECFRSCQFVPVLLQTSHDKSAKVAATWFRRALDGGATKDRNNILQEHHIKAIREWLLAHEPSSSSKARQLQRPRSD